MIVPHVHAKDTIGNDLAIELRLGDDSTVTSVLHTNGASSTEVTVDTSGLDFGEHTLVLESFDTNSEGMSTLKAYTVTIFVVAPQEVVQEVIIPPTLPL